MGQAAQQWAEDLASWAIPPEILEQAPESPWIHPVQMFTVDAEVPDSPSHQRAREALPEGGSLLDVGCGGGRATVALAGRLGRATGVDTSSAMLEKFAAAVGALGVDHAEVLGGWPDVADATPQADVVVCHHVAYNVADLTPFVLALDSHAIHRVVLELPTHHPLTWMNPLWHQFWGIDRPIAPTAQDALAVVRDAGIDARLETWDDDAPRPISAEEHARFTRIRLCLPPEREPEVAAALAAAGPAGARHGATIWWDRR